MAERRQVIDVPVSAFDVVEHRTLAVHLTQGQMLPYARAAELIADVYCLAISPAMLLGWVAETGAAQQPTVDQIAEHLRAAPRPQQTIRYHRHQNLSVRV